MFLILALYHTFTFINSAFSNRKSFTIRVEVDPEFKIDRNILTSGSWSFVTGST